MPAGVCEAAARWGSLPLEQLAAPAAQLARDGVTINRAQAYVGRDAFAHKLRRWLPLSLADKATRWKNVLLGMFFFSRARAIRPGFEDDGSLRAICRRLDYLPLALELAAARVKASLAGEELSNCDVARSTILKPC